MWCPRCQSSNADTHRYCSQCGLPLQQESDAPLAGATDHERKNVTMLFADLSGSLALMAARDPEDARRLLLSVLDLLIGAVRDSGGIVNQVMGDGIMALFGAPTADEYHALRACLAAIRMHEAVARFDEATRSEREAELRIRVGINSGEVVVGVRGQGYDSQYTAFGEAAHLAARVESLATPGRTLITASTHTLVAGNVMAEPLGQVPVRGLGRTLDVFELHGLRPGRISRRSSFGQTPLIGRTDELDIVRQRLERAAAGGGQAVLLSGEPGVGKSRLIAECLADAAQHGWLTLHSGGAAYASRVSYFAIRDALRSYFVLQGDEDEAVRRSAITRRLRALEAGPAFAEAAILGLFGVSDPVWDAMSPRERRPRLIQALIWLTLAESRRQPVIWAIEDMQWADAETETFLSDLVRAIAEARVVVLMDHRPEYRSKLSDDTSTVRLEITRLANRALALLLDEVLGADVSLGPVKRLLAQRTGGNPFFVEECIRMLLDAGALGGVPGDYRRLAPADDLLPTNVQGILAARMDRLSHKGRRLLQAAALIGQQINPVVLQDLVGVSAAELESQVAELRGAGFLQDTMQYFGPGYAFVHALSHDVAYRSLLQEARQTLHARVVGILETLHGDQVAEHAEILGWHAVRGRQWIKAAHYMREAGNKALSHLACEAAVSHFEDALQALEHLPADADNMRSGCDLRLELRNALFPLARHREMLACLTTAKILAESLSDVSREARAAAHLCHCHWLTGDWDNAIATGGEALALAERIGDVGMQVWSRFFKAIAHYSLGEFDQAALLLEANAAVLQGDLATKRFGGFSLPAVVGADWLAWCLAEQGHFADALRHGEAGLVLAERAGQPFDRVHGLLGVGGVHAMQGDAERAIPPLASAIALCDAHDLISVRPRVASMLALASALAGRHEAAIALAHQAARHASDMRHGVLSTTSQYRLAEVLVLCGRSAEALVHAETVLKASRQTRERGLEAAALRLIGEALAAQGALNEAARSLRTALDLAEHLGMRPLVAHCHLGLATVEHASGRPIEAQRASDAADTLFDELGMTTWLRRVRPPTAILSPTPMA